MLYDVSSSLPLSQYNYIYILNAEPCEYSMVSIQLACGYLHFGKYHTIDHLLYANLSPVSVSPCHSGFTSSVQAGIARRDDSIKRLEDMCEHLKAQVSLPLIMYFTITFDCSVCL